MKRTLCFFIWSICFLTFACKKVDEYITQLDESPSIQLEQMTFWDFPKSGDITRVYYPSKVTPGESVTLAGRNISSSGTRIFLGDYELSFSLVGIDTVSDYTSRYEIAVEVIRFSVPYDIDAGLKALSVRKPSGELFNFPEIDVVSIAQVGGTDTLLRVSSVFDDIIPDFEMRYAQQTSSRYITASSVTGDGTIYIQTKLDVYRLKEGVLRTVIRSGELIYINGKALQIREILGFHATRDGGEFYLSVDAVDSNQSDYDGCWLLLKGSTSSFPLNFSPLNITYYRNRGSAQLAALPSSNALNGAAELQAIRATYLSEDLSGNLYFIRQTGTSAYDAYQPEIARLGSSGEMTTILAARNGLEYCDVFLGYAPDGNSCYFTHERQNSYPYSSGLTYYDLAWEIPLAMAPSRTEFQQVSFASDPSLGFTSPFKIFNRVLPLYSETYYYGKFMVMPSGELLMVDDRSLLAVNADKRSIYVYAGRERSMSSQRNETGSALDVNFYDVQLLGIDDQHNLYFAREGGYRQGVPLPFRVFKLSR